MRRQREKMVGMFEVSTGTHVAAARRRAVAGIERAKAILERLEGRLTDEPSGLRHHDPRSALLEADLYCDMATLWNALTHPSVGSRGLSDYKEPVDVLMLLSKDEVAKVCDLVVGAIFALNEAIARRFQDVAVWLHERGPDGAFPMPGTYDRALLGKEPDGQGGDATS